MSAASDALRHMVEEGDESGFAPEFIADVNPRLLARVGRKPAKRSVDTSARAARQSPSHKQRLQALIDQMPNLHDLPLEPDDTAPTITAWE